MCDACGTELMTLKDISVELRIGVRTLWRWMSVGTFPHLILRRRREATALAA